MSRSFSKHITELPTEETVTSEPEQEEKEEPDKPVKTTLRESYNAILMRDMIPKEVSEPDDVNENPEDQEDEEMSKSIYFMMKGIRMMMKRLKHDDK